MNETPEWVLRMVADLDRYEDTHARDADVCFLQALVDVPPDVLTSARTYARFANRPYSPATT